MGREAANPGSAPQIGSGAPPGICGPDVTAEVAAIWSKIQADFASWSKAQQDEACTRILIPVKKPVWKPGINPKDFLRSAADINGWDVLPLFQGASKWLRS